MKNVKTRCSWFWEVIHHIWLFRVSLMHFTSINLCQNWWKINRGTNLSSDTWDFIEQAHHRQLVSTSTATLGNDTHASSSKHFLNTTFPIQWFFGHDTVDCIPVEFPEKAQASNSIPVTLKHLMSVYLYMSTWNTIIIQQNKHQFFIKK